MEIRLVVNGNLVHTAVVPQLQLVASRVSRPGVSLLSEGPQGVPSIRRLRVSMDMRLVHLDVEDRTALCHTPEGT